MTINGLNTKIKDYLGVAIIIISAVFAYAVLSYVNTYSKSIEPSSFRSFTVTGEGKVVVVPDVAQFTFSVISEGGNDVTALQEQNTEKSNKITDFLKKNGIDEKDIKTINYSVEPRQEYYSCPPVYYRGEVSAVEGTSVSGVAVPDGPQSTSIPSPRPCPPPKIVGYTIRRTDQVKIRDFKKIGDILAGVVSSGANEVSQLYFTVDDPTKVQNDAREEAITKAREKAKMIARAGGFRLGRLLNINEGGYYPPIPFYGKEAAGIGGAGDAYIAPNIQPGSEDVTVNVTMVFEIK